MLDDEKQFTEELSEFFKDSNYGAYEANNVGDGRRILNENEIDLLILDVRLPGVSGLDILQEVKIQHPSMEVIIISAHGDMETVIKAMRLGAFDYIRKPFRFIDIQIAIERTQKYLQMQRKLKRMEEKNSLITKTLESKINRQFIGVSNQIINVCEKAKIAANYPDANVLITGESGTGKENISRIIHFCCCRNENVFCAVNSSSITDTLLESEFFGHKKGSFTGAINDKMGFFEVCNKGTLFLDEIGNLPLQLQPKLLSVLQNRIITPIGSNKPVPVDIRLICATNRKPDEMVAAGTFREDLLYRINTIHIDIPPLRERKEDIPAIAEYFLKIYC
ncbi:MAG: sigma-54 dependent transcriptional regulator, partial [Flavobacteriaceae bacterium]|nr:sigma-54 dependent transcriptional regulator [Flavobacteriaceae bacterium]